MIEVFQRGVFVSGQPLLLTVHRCGHSFKFIGVDLRRCASYVGYCYGPQTLEVLEATQPKHPTKAMVLADAVGARKARALWDKAVSREKKKKKKEGG